MVHAPPMLGLANDYEKEKHRNTMTYLICFNICVYTTSTCMHHNMCAKRRPPTSAYVRYRSQRIPNANEYTKQNCTTMVQNVPRLHEPQHHWQTQLGMPKQHEQIQLNIYQAGANPQVIVSNKIEDVFSST